MEQIVIVLIFGLPAVILPLPVSVMDVFKSVRARFVTENICLHPQN
jgi:hypothetical protein